MPLHKVYSKVTGSRIQIDFYGTAENDSPALVPQAVADELAARDDLRIVAPDPEPSSTSTASSSRAVKAAPVPEQAASPAEEK